MKHIFLYSSDMYLLLLRATCHIIGIIVLKQRGDEIWWIA